MFNERFPSRKAAEKAIREFGVSGRVAVASQTGWRIIRAPVYTPSRAVALAAALAGIAADLRAQAIDGSGKASPERFALLKAKVDACNALTDAAR
jgi:hypothetical protein